MQAKVSVVPALDLVSPVIGTDSIDAKKVNRKANGIKGLANYPHASVSFPTVTFGSENKSTPPMDSLAYSCQRLVRFDENLDHSIE